MLLAFYYYRGRFRIFMGGGGCQRLCARASCLWPGSRTRLRVLRMPPTKRKTNAWVLDKIGNRLMLREMVQRQKLHFFGHVIQRKGLERTIITGKVNRKRKRGHPPTSWLKDIKSSTGLTMQEAVRAAEDRERC